jgi:metacaspase-1
MAKRSLHIGINNYPGTDSDLYGCVNDANDWASFSSARGVPSPTVLTDATATKAAVVTAMRRLVNDTASGDVGIVTYSGHGSWTVDDDADEVDGRDECWVLWDFSVGGLLTDDEIFDIYSYQKTGAVHYLISDSCHSGTINRFIGGGVTQAKGKPRFLPPAHFMTDSQKRKAKAVERTAISGPSRKSPIFLSGCHDTEYSYDAVFEGKPNGAFTWAAQRAYVPGMRVGAWHSAIRAILPTPDFPQSPQLAATVLEKYKVAF